MFDDNFFRNVAILCQNLAPTAGPFLEASGNVAAALDNAQRETRQAESLAERIERQRAAMELPPMSEEQLTRYLTEEEDA